MYIMDCRPKLSAVGNMAKGLGIKSIFVVLLHFCNSISLGYEKPEGYSEHSCEIVWMGIDNIHGNYQHYLIIIAHFRWYLLFN